MTSIPEVRIHRFDVVGSTNAIALDMAREGEPEGLVVTASAQTRGRGRRGRVWQDEPGACVLMSVLLTPDLPQSRLPELTFVASLSVAEFLIDSFGVEAMLKWPNDVMVGDRKICGILLETTQTPTGQAAVVGIGLNVNQAGFPPDIADSATSLRLEAGRVHAVDAVVEPLAEVLFSNYHAYMSAGFEEILNRWRKYMWRIGRRAVVTAGNTTVTGVISGVDCTGALVITDTDGGEHAILAADEIRFLDD